MKTVLLAEDDEHDIFLMKMACKRSGIPHRLEVVQDGAAAMDYLAGKPPYDDRLEHPFPDVVFLDVKMPRHTGLEVLQWIQQQPNLRRVPVVMLTSSRLENDVNRAYELGAISYLQKVSDAAEFGQGVRVILKYWLELNKGC